MLIIEGSDAVGKTTLCHELVAKLPRHMYSHLSRPAPKFNKYWDYVDRMNQYLVQDRYHLSEIVYAEMRGDKTDLTPEVYRLVDARARLIPAFTVVVVADSELIESRWKHTEDEQMYSLQQSLEVNLMFDKLDQYFPKFEIDVDMKIICNHRTPYPTTFIKEICERYVKRFEETIGLRSQRTQQL